MINSDNIRVQWTLTKTMEELIKQTHLEYNKSVEYANYKDFYTYIIYEGLKKAMHEIKEYKALGIRKDEIKAE